MTTLFRPAATLLVLFTLLTGVLYPGVVTASAQLLFPEQANGSLLERGKEVVGSRLLGQSFNEPGHFWSRPSATSPSPYNASASSGSNWGPTNPALRAQVHERVAALRAADPSSSSIPVPIDLVTASASGLDPHISPAAALFQVPRVARVRGLKEKDIRTLVLRHIEDRSWGILGEPRVNVVLLNLELDSGVQAESEPKPR